MVVRRLRPLILATFAVTAISTAQSTRERWAVILEEPPVAPKPEGARFADARSSIMSRQAALHETAQSRNLMPLGATQHLLNAIYVAGSEADARSFEGMPGVARVVRLRPIRMAAAPDDMALRLMNTQAAWNTLGGADRAGTGIRIAILDSGIDSTHPAFQDGSLVAPAGFPRVTRESDRAFTNNKVIVARSYIDQLVLGDRPEISRPDDLSARDRVGHGTAVAMLAAGVRHEGSFASASGVAPKAFLGNYKVFGSPGVNDFTFADVLIRALEDAAVVDRMDVATLSLGDVAEWGPLDRCSQNTRACDPFADAIENAVRNYRMAVVVSAGNNGDVGFNLPTPGTITSPGTAPAAITVGASTNGQIYYQSARPEGDGVPADFRRFNIRFADGPLPAAPFTAGLRDVASVADDGRSTTGCRPLGNGTLIGSIVIVNRGDCARPLKVTYAQRAGAVAVLLVQFDGDNAPVPFRGLDGTGIPLASIGATDAQRLRTLLRQNPELRVTLDPAYTTVNAPADEVAYFSSQGPAIGTGAIKPELVAVGTDLAVATQNYDANGSLYSADRYLSVQGTSFAVPLVAGAVALVKQRNTALTASDLKSAVVNSAGGTLTDFDNNGRPVTPARITAVGAGKLDVGRALTTVITADPATISFGAVTTGVLPSIPLNLTNTTSTPQNVRIEAQPTGRISVVPSTFALGSLSTTRVVVRLDARPQPGSYEGVLLISYGTQSIRVPYLYQVGDGVANNIYSLIGDFSQGYVNQGSGNTNERRRMSFKIVDRYGVPVPNVNVRWSVVSGGGRIDQANERTDEYGIGEAFIVLGAQLGEQVFRVEGAGLTQPFSVFVRQLPAIRTGGVVDAASGQSRGLAPGSYISIFGAGLADVTQVFRSPFLPVSLVGVSVSFDAPAQRLSVPGRIHFVSDGQINVQIPWELQGLTGVQMKVSIGDLSSAVLTVPLADFSPGFFEYQDSGSGRQLAAALDGSFALVSGANPVRRGQPIQFYVNGLGRVSNTPVSGEASAADPLSQTLETPVVQIAGRGAQVLFSGLAPGIVGLYQVNVIVPSDAPAGLQPVNLSIGGVAARATSIPVQ